MPPSASAVFDFSVVTPCVMNAIRRDQVHKFAMEYGAHPFGLYVDYAFGTHLRSNLPPELQALAKVQIEKSRTTTWHIARDKTHAIFGVLGWYPLEGRPLIYAAFVRKSSRQCGIGAYLVTAALDEIKRLGHAIVEVDMLVNPKLQRRMLLGGFVLTPPTFKVGTDGPSFRTDMALKLFSNPEHVKYIDDACDSGNYTAQIYEKITSELALRKKASALLLFSPRLTVATFCEQFPTLVVHTDAGPCISMFKTF